MEIENKNNKIKEGTQPGECVSVDSFESSTAGLTAKLKGIIINQRYKIATVFIDHYSDLSYVLCRMTTQTQKSKKKN